MASGHAIMDSSVANEISIFLLMKEFGGLPSQWKRESIKDIKFVTTLLSSYNQAKNAEIQREIKGKSGKSSRGNKMTSGKFRREERIGPNGIEIVDIPI